MLLSYFFLSEILRKTKIFRLKRNFMGLLPREQGKKPKIIMVFTQN